MKKTILTGLALILMLVFTCAAVLAEEAPAEWRIADYIRLWLVGEIPESFDTGFTGGPETVVDGVRFRMTDVLANSTHTVVLTEISMADGSPALFLEGPGDVGEMPLWTRMYGVADDDPRTVQDYMAEKQLPLVRIDSIPDVENCIHWGVDQWFADDYRTMMITDIYYGPMETQELSFDWAFARLKDGAWSNEGDVELSEMVTEEKKTSMVFPLAKEVTETIAVGKEVDTPFGPVRLDKVTVSRSAAETVMNAVYSVEADGDELPEGLEEYRFIPVYPEEDELWDVPEIFSEVRQQEWAKDRESGRFVCFQTRSLALAPEADTLQLAFCMSVRSLDGAEVLTLDIPKAE